MDRRTLFAVLAAVVLISVIGLSWAGFHGGSGELIVIDFDPDAAEAHIDALISNGPRMSASDAEEKGAQYILKQFEAAGLENCHIEKFSANMFDIRQASVAMVDYGPLGLSPFPGASPVEYEHMTEYVLQGYSGSYSWSDYGDDLSVVNIGDGSNAESYSQAAGSACLVEWGENTPGNPDVFRYGAEAGVSAIILQNMKFGKELGYPPIFKTNYAYETWEGSFPEIPFFMVSKDVGEDIKTRSSGAKMRLMFDVAKGPMEISVVVGEIVGSETPEELYIIGGHHDTCYNTLGVVDNTVGPAIVMEMARQMAKFQPKSTIRFCTWGGEEEGCFGSELYFEKHREELKKNLKMYCNFDMSHTDIDRVNGFAVATSINSSIEVMEAIRDQMVASSPELEKYDISVYWDDGKWTGSDQWAFAREGLDVTNCWGGGSYEYHTYMDDKSRLNAESLQIGGRIIGSYILTMTC